MPTQTKCDDDILMLQKQTVEKACMLTEGDDAHNNMQGDRTLPRSGSITTLRELALI